MDYRVIFKAGAKEHAVVVRSSETVLDAAERATIVIRKLEDSPGEWHGAQIRIQQLGH